MFADFTSEFGGRNRCVHMYVYDLELFLNCEAIYLWSKTNTVYRQQYTEKSKKRLGFGELEHPELTPVDTRIVCGRKYYVTIVFL